MDPATISAIVGGGVALATGVGSTVARANLNKKNRRHEFDVMKANQEYNDQKILQNQQMAIDFWNMENEYNSDKQKMARMKEAGLNTNLMYGGASAATDAGALDAGMMSAPDYATHHQNPSPVDMSAVAQYAANLPAFFQKNEKQEFDMDIKSKEFLLKQSKWMMEEQDWKNKFEKHAFWNQTKDLIKNGMELQNVKTGAQTELLRVQKEQAQSVIDMNHKNIEVMSSQIGLNQSQTGLLQAETRLMNVRINIAQMDEKFHMQKLIDEQTRRKLENIGLRLENGYLSVNTQFLKEVFRNAKAMNKMNEELKAYQVENKEEYFWQDMITGYANCLTNLIGSFRKGNHTTNVTNTTNNNSW